RLKACTLLVRDEARLAKIDGETLRDIIDARQSGKESVHALHRDIARSRQLVIRIRDDRRIARELVAAFVQPGNRIQPELLDNLRLFGELLLRVGEVETERMHR